MKNLPEGGGVLFFLVGGRMAPYTSSSMCFMFFVGQLSVVDDYLCMGQAKLPPNTGNPIAAAADPFEGIF